MATSRAVDPPPHWGLLLAVAAVPFLVLAGLSVGVCEIGSSTTAAWVQAIGSVLVIWQAYRMGQSRERAEIRGALKHAAIFKASVLDCLVALRHAAECHDRFGLAQAKAALADALDLGKAVRMELLEPLDALAVSRFRTCAARTRDFEVGPNSEAFDFPFIANEAQQLLNDCVAADRSRT
jgi:hypothetical protein